MPRIIFTCFNQLSGPAKGVVWMLLAAFCLTGMAVAVRVLSQSLHIFEIVFFRTALGVPLMLPWLYRVGLSGLRTKNARLLTLRAFMTATAATLYFWGLKLIPLADATAIMFTRPMFAAILAMIFLHEVVSRRRWTAMAAGFAGVVFLMTFFPGAAMLPISDSQALIFTAPLFASVMAVLFLGEVLRIRRIVALIIGFVGALIILRPGLQEISLGALLVLIAAGANSTSHIIVKYAMRSDHPDLAVLYLSLFVTPLMLLPALYVWITPNWTQLGLMVAIGALATINQRCITRAFASADATAVLPFDFARLPFAAAIGFLVFAELPDLWVWVGGGVIFASSVYIAHREAIAARS